MCIRDSGCGAYFFGSEILKIYTADPEVIRCGLEILSYTTVPYFLCGIMAVSYTHLDVYKRQDYNHEVVTEYLIKEAWKAGKEVAVPKVVGKDMVFYKLTDFARLEPGYFGIP